MSKILFIKPPDRFLENEFVFQQLGPHFLQSYLKDHGIESDLMILYERPEVRKLKNDSSDHQDSLNDLNMLILMPDGSSLDIEYDDEFFKQYFIVGFSVMSPQASDAYALNMRLRERFPHITTVIGGSHARYYLNEVKALPEHLAFHYIIPMDAWDPVLKIAREHREGKGRVEFSVVLNDVMQRVTEVPPPTRPLELMRKYNFQIAGVPAFHTISAIGCPFTCNFCESGAEKVKKFSHQMLEEDLKLMARVHEELGNQQKGVMFFDDVGLMSPAQVDGLSSLIKKYNYDTWRAFTHAYLVVKFKERLLQPFFNTGGRRIGLGLETGSQRSLDMINKRNGQPLSVDDHYEAVRIANKMGIAVDAFTMIYPWEDEKDLEQTTRLVEFVASNQVESFDSQGRRLKNHVDSTIMTPYQGTKFYTMINGGDLPGVKMKEAIDPGLLFYKGNSGGSGWPYIETRLPRDEYERVQKYRNSLRPKYR